MMKRLLKGLWYSLLLLLLLAGSPIPNARAQSATDSISSLYVSLWPDFDRRSVLVILTGTLPADASFPADVTLPFPDNGELNAVARVDVDDRMIDDIEFSRSPGTIELTTPDPRFRVEYYFPYSVDGKQRAFDFAWSASVSVEQFNVAVQEPIGANALVMVPSAVDMVAGQHGMTNHLLQSQPVPAGQTFVVQVSYEMLAPHLSVEAFSARAGPVAGNPTSAPAAASAAVPPSAPAAPTISSWAVIFGVSSVALITLVVFWQIGRARTTRSTAASSAIRADDGASVNFCHSCGHSVRPGDNFCFACGTKLA